VELFSTILVIVINLGVGGLILVRARGSDSRPEQLLGWGLVFDGLEWLLWFLAAYTPLDGTPLGLTLSVMCRFGIAVASWFLLAFTRAVFYPDARGATIFTACAIGFIWIGIAGSLAISDWHGYRTDLPWVWMENGGTVLAYGWIFVAAAAYYARARRRLVLDMGDATVVNRILLWSIYGGSTVAGQILYLYAITFHETSGHYPRVFDTIIAGLTVAACVAIWLAFFPPERYRRWVSAAAPAD